MSDMGIKGKKRRYEKRKARKRKVEHAGKHFRKIGISLGVSIGILVLLYGITALFFNWYFLPNTIINDKNCSMMSIKKVEDLFEKEADEYILTLTDKDGNTEKITGKEIETAYKKDDEISQLARKQKYFLWPVSFFKEQKIRLPLHMEYNEEKLNQAIERLHIVSIEQTEPVSAYPVYNGKEYVVQKEQYGTKILTDQLQSQIEQSIREVNKTLNLLDAGCYESPRFTADSEEVQKACKVLNQYCKAEITYDIGEKKETVDHSLISQWLSVDDEMNVQFNEKKIKEWLSDLGKTYDTVGKKRTFTTADGRSAEVSGGTYGWEIDEQKELNQLTEEIQEGKKETRTPAYCEGKTAVTHDTPDWGNTYAEVDLTRQYMWYVEDGDMKLETDVVTGKPVDNRNTPEGVYSILELMNGKTLVGEKNPATGEPIYRTWVNYWMRITWTGVGFHDAVWQDRFGGDWYIEHGSHGCINMRLDDAEKLYSMLQKGTPVIIHY